MSLLAIFYFKKMKIFVKKIDKMRVFQKLKGKFSITQVNFMKTQANVCENSRKILSKFKQNPQKLNLPEIPVTSVAAKMTKKKPALCIWCLIF